MLRIASECPDSSSLHIMKSQAQQLFSMQSQADDLPKDIPDLGTLGNYLLTRQVALHLPAKLQILLHIMHTGLPCCFTDLDRLLLFLICYVLVQMAREHCS